MDGARGASGPGPRRSRPPGRGRRRQSAALGPRGAVGGSGAAAVRGSAGRPSGGHPSGRAGAPRRPRSWAPVLAAARQCCEVQRRCGVRRGCGDPRRAGHRPVGRVHRRGVVPDGHPQPDPHARGHHAREHPGARPFPVATFPVATDPPIGTATVPWCRPDAHLARDRDRTRRAHHAPTAAAFVHDRRTSAPPGGSGCPGGTDTVAADADGARAIERRPKRTMAGARRPPPSQRKVPAASYSPRDTRPKYHRRWRA